MSSRTAQYPDEVTWQSVVHRRWTEHVEFQVQLRLVMTCVSYIVQVVAL